MTHSNIVRLGDPHLGKVFKNGVPLHRRGEREKSVVHDFKMSLMNATNHLHICMGDLFDERDVPYEVVLLAVQAYKLAASTNPNSVYVVERGNHDASRIAGEASAYDVFAEALRGTKGVFVLGNDPLAIEGHLILPWHPFRSAADMVPKRGNFKSVNGHWDVRDFSGGTNPNLLPTELLSGITDSVFSGHEHKPQSILNTATGFNVELVGSMQPYAFGEEASPKDYLTLSLREIEGFQGSLHDKTVRVLLRPGEQAPADLDCRQIVVQRVNEDDVPADISVSVADFDLAKLWNESADECGVTDDKRKEIWETLNK